MNIKDYENALLSQGAANLSGLVHSLSAIVSRLWDDPECTGTEWVNTHPIVVLYATQIAYLSGLGMCSNHDAYNAAYHACEEKAAFTNPIHTGGMV